LAVTGCIQDVLLDSPVYISAATAAGLVLLIAWILRHEPFPGRRYFIATLIGMTIWVGMATVEMMVQGPGCKVAAALATWPAIALVPVAWSLFIWHFCFAPATHGNRAEGIALAVIILAVSAVAFSNPLHGLLYGPATVLVAGAARPYVDFDHGPMFHVIAVFLYAFMVLSLVVAGMAAFRSSRTLRPLMFLLMCATLVPMVTNIAYLFLEARIAGFDPTPFAFSFVLLVLTWAIYATRGLDLASVARDLLYFNTLDPVVVVDAKGRVVGANAAAAKAIPHLHHNDRIRADGPLAPLAEVLGGTRPELGQADVTIAERRFRMRVLPIPRPMTESGAHLGAVAILTDMTALEAQNAQLTAALENSRRQVEEISRLREIAETSAMSDPLTKIGNRRALELRAEALKDEAMSVALLDLDHFKVINDKLGHAVGDRVLKDFAAIARDGLPPHAGIFRIGGEEFVVLAGGMPMPDFVALLDQLKRQLAERVVLRETDVAQVTFSAGVAISPEDGHDLNELYETADARLYMAKQSGRDRIIHEGRLPSRVGWTAEPYLVHRERRG
jgi:diguanylate cyclase (GGDEF)-like protein